MDVSQVVPRHDITSSGLKALRELDAKNAELRARNEMRIEQFKLSMGKRWVLHTDNAPEKTAYKAVLS